MTAAPPQTAEQTERAFDEAHRRLLEDGSIQFAMQPFQPNEPPAWLGWLFEALGHAWPAIRILFWAGLAALLLYALYRLAQRLSGKDWSWRRSERIQAEAEWSPDEGTARALLSDADRLAGEGRFNEAAHLLLFRSIDDIEARRPKTIRPALTSRDILAAPNLPEEPRRAFRSIVMAVEGSLFGGRRLDRYDWEQCRSAYEAFALRNAWAQ